ncbi:MAG: thiamine-phosphate kinase [Chitinophagaceae bacterium]|jgi:thiamine-monophosphate kinase|nr:thiamine-phosphate kinase [Chitinophagaceae bacterium]MBP6045816.1 thiamine-phosphate kinase [Ferruginibacter sp.]MBK8929643.1 thiamine-phosphate kinase [Chitinophagaceae bacterium]MBL0254136.1 thiamine-phosphate kinase [Chitinophagaceae bacterium]MBP6371838.1 thiamine-phosphate kinase [Ferruginibacter sp.]
MDQRAEISTLGEFGLINHLTQNNETKNASTILSVGDDAAVIDNFGRQTVVSTDLLIEGIHFDLSYTPLKHLGYKSIVVNLSDIYAMNATPSQVTVSIAFSNRFGLEALDELYSGIYAACDKYQVDLIGGDTSTSQKGLIISVTAIGEVAPGNFIKRSTAKPNDLICVSGELGGAFLGLTLLEREKKIFEETGAQPDLENQAYIVGRLLKPEARNDIIAFFAEKEIAPSAMMDISDGLSSDILHICNQSRVGCVLYEDKFPIHEEAKQFAYKLQLDPTACALSGGEDYELLFTISQTDYEIVKDNKEISVIGFITEEKEGSVIITRAGNKHQLIAQGWNHAIPK